MQMIKSLFLFTFTVMFLSAPATNVHGQSISPAQLPQFQKFANQTKKLGVYNFAVSKVGTPGSRKALFLYTKQLEAFQREIKRGYRVKIGGRRDRVSRSFHTTTGFRRMPALTVMSPCMAANFRH